MVSVVSVQEVMDIMEGFAPKHLAEDWDNPGLLVGSPAQRTERIVCCLDVSDGVVQQAIEADAHLIVAHHPLIFKAMKNVRTDLPLGARIAKLLKHDIAVLAAHTNLDIAEGGVNDVLAEAIGVRKLSSFVIEQQDADGHAASLGRIGSLPAPMTIADFAAQVREALPTAHVRYVDAGPRPVRKVALCSGSGAEFIGRAAALGADAYLTGDVRYHDAQHAAELGLHLIDAGHFGTEFPVVAALAARLRTLFDERSWRVEVVEDTAARDFFQVL